MPPILYQAADLGEGKHGNLEQDTDLDSGGVDSVGGWGCRAESNNRNTDWFKEARYGVFMHFLPGDAQQLALTEQFDVDALARQLEEIGAKYFVLTLQQNSGYCVSPNRAYSRITKYCPGERASQRDLPLDLYNALYPRGIRLMLYLPCQPPNRDTLAQRAFGLPEGPADQPLNEEVAQKWAEVIQEWSDRYGDKVAGWWFDGGYEHIQFNEAIARIYAQAVKHGNPDAIVTFNPGVKSSAVHPVGRLHGRGTERAVRTRFPPRGLARRLTVACVDLPRSKLVGPGNPGTRRKNGRVGEGRHRPGRCRSPWTWAPTGTRPKAAGIGSLAPDSGRAGQGDPGRL
jgi:hypothetical protein